MKIEMPNECKEGYRDPVVKEYFRRQGQIGGLRNVARKSQEENKSHMKLTVAEARMSNVGLP